MGVQTKSDYEALLKRLENKMGNTYRKEASRLEIPTPQIIWVGQRHFFSEFMEFAKALREIQKNYYFISIKNSLLPVILLVSE